LTTKTQLVVLSVDDLDYGGVNKTNILNIKKYPFTYAQVSL